MKRSVKRACRKAIAARLCAAAFVLCSALSQRAVAAEPTVDEIVDKALRANYYPGQDGRARVSMTIIDKQGRERRRELTILRRDDVEKDPEDAFLGDQKFFVYFNRPSDVRKMVFMVWKHTGGDDDRWLYLPSLDLVKRIASSEERTSFAGSHFFYEDVSGRGKEKDAHEIVETTENFYVLEHRPKKAGAVEFSSYRTWIHKATFIVTQTKYFDAEGGNYRTYTALEVQEIQGYPTVTKGRMEDTRIGGHTDLEYSGISYDIGLPDDIFTERYLRRAPVKYLR
jgi:outer membrane lipoprotein-sorting protein